MAPKRYVLLTGAAGGIGSALTKALIANGHVVAGIDCDLKGLKQLESALSRWADAFLPIQADLTNEDDCVSAIEIAASKFGAINAVINNAGIGVSSIRPNAESDHPSISEITAQIWDRFFAINVRAPMLVVRNALPYLKKSHWGRIVNNTTSYRTMLRVLPYGATKSALESMSAVWAVELAKTNITVNVVVPGGPTDTKLISDESGWPRDKMLRPDILSAPICWLMSDEANGVTGRRLTGKDWDANIPSIEAYHKASRPIGWPELAAKPAAWQ
jgi:NAD(P)-dependent dehydrogenase (short-subunit alcohol dehydrogenase family)